MLYNKHLELEGKHAILSPSSYHWANREDEDSEEFLDYLQKKLKSSYAQAIGTLLHEYAADRINYGLKLNKNEQNAVMMHLRKNGIPKSCIDMENVYPNLRNYVNDGILYHMDTEKLLVYSDVCYGTTDAICLDKNILRIHDLKTGTSPASMKQLELYAGLFFLEYGDREGIYPDTTPVSLRIYQNGEVQNYEPPAEEILSIMDTIVFSSDAVKQFLRED